MTAAKKTKTKDGTYNGWTNRATWAVNLHIGNERASYNFWSNRARELWRDRRDIEQVVDDVWKPKEAAIFTLADELEETFKDIDFDFGPQCTCLMVKDLFNCALSQVNWEEIAKSMIADAAQSTKGGAP